MGDVSNWQGGAQAPIAPPPPSGPTTAEVAALQEIRRLNDRFFRKDPIDPQEAVYGFAPGGGPARAADELERRLGVLDELPSWMNASQFADSASEYASGGSDAPADPLRARSSQWLMHPVRYEYMQAGPGRAIDLLRGLRDNPVRAGDFYRRSAGARTTRNGYTSPNYQRYSGFGPAAAEFLTNPLSGVGRYLQWQSVIPTRLNHGASGATPQQSWGWANARDIASQRFRQGEVPILDVASPEPGESMADQAERYWSRLDAVSPDLQALMPSTPEDLGRNLFGSRIATPAMGAAADTALGFVDATAPAGLLGGLARTPAAALKLAARRAVTQSANVSRAAARRMMRDAAEAWPEETVLRHGERAAASRGVPSAAYADALKRPSVADLAGEAGRTIALNEGAPELALEGVVSAALPQPERTWGEFLFGPATAESDQEFQKRQADRLEAAERAAIRMENLSHSESQNNIWNEAYRANEARRRREGEWLLKNSGRNDGWEVREAF